MEIVYEEARLEAYIAESTEISPTRPVLVDRFLDDAIEIDVDALYDGHELLPRRCHGAHRGGRHPLRRLGLRPAPITLGGFDIKRLRASTEAIAKGVGVRGLINIQFAMAGDILCVLRPTRAPPARCPSPPRPLAVPLAKAAARISLGATIAELREEGLLPRNGDGGELPMDAPISVKEAVMPWSRFRDIHGRASTPSRPGDALHRRGHGHRRRLRHRVREVAGRRLRAAALPRAARSSPSPTATSAR